MATAAPLVLGPFDGRSSWVPPAGSPWRGPVPTRAEGAALPESRRFTPEEWEAENAARLAAKTSGAVAVAAMEIAAAIVDQLHQDSCLFHERVDSDELLLMRHFHALDERSEGCTWQLAKKKGSRKHQAIGAEKFAEVVAQLVANGYGRRTCDQPLT